ncbi:MAG: transporter [Bacteroidales bacterium]|nr:transporter [Bacteroidales bacterium]
MSLFSKIIEFVKDWALPIAMIIGVLSYFVFQWCDFSLEVRAFANDFVAVVQPVLLFFMLFLSFCKIDPKKIRICKWHLWFALLQSVSFTLLAFAVKIFPGENTQIIIECAMCCMICPTATAAVVIVDKLGGNKLSLVANTILSNMVTSIVVPIVVPIVNPGIGMSFFQSFFIIIRQVFPLLVFPFFLAWAVRVFFPRLLEILLKVKDLAFYLWIVALVLALAVTTKALVHSNVSVLCMVGMSVVTLFCCLFQFYFGKKIGGLYNDRISGGQALGQKSTVFMIWMGATFMNPVTAVAGGLYSICHNTVNSYQLYKKRRQ